MTYLLVARRLTKTQAAKVLGVSRKTIVDKFKAHGLGELIMGYQPDAGEAKSDGDPNRDMSFKELAREAAEKKEKEVLTELFFQEGLNKLEISRRTGLSYKTVISKLNQYGIVRQVGPKAQEQARPDEAEAEETRVALTEATSIADAMLKLGCETRGELMELCREYKLSGMLARLLPQ